MIYLIHFHNLVTVKIMLIVRWNGNQELKHCITVNNIQLLYWIVYDYLRYVVMIWFRQMFHGPLSG